MSSNSAFEGEPPTWFEAVHRDLEQTFNTLDRHPDWESPHDGREPEGWQYKETMSRAKLSLVVSRWRAWTTVLTNQGLAELTRDEHLPESWRGLRRPLSDLEWSERLTPVMEGAASLLAAGTLVDGAPFGLDVGYAIGGSPAIFAGPVPVCGCVGCDYGSEDLTDGLDRWVEAVVSGGIVPASPTPAWR